MTAAPSARERRDRMRLSANISMLFAELAMPARFAAARAAGFDCVEIQFPGEHDIDVLAAARAAADIPVSLINIPRGGAEEAGLAALPGREEDFAEAVEACAEHAARLGARKVNVLAGFPPPGTDPEDAQAVLAGNLARAAARFAPLGVGVMVEPVNPVDRPGFALTSLDDALAVIARAGHPGLRVQFDLYHMARTEPDLVAAIRRAGPSIGHVQFADVPGRGPPGTGGVDFAAALRALKAAGYDGDVAAEYLPGEDTRAGLGWMARFRALMDDHDSKNEETGP